MTHIAVAKASFVVRTVFVRHIEQAISSISNLVGTTTTGSGMAYISGKQVRSGVSSLLAPQKGIKKFLGERSGIPMS